MKNRGLWIGLTIMSVLLAVPSAVVAFMSVFLFDAPGSDKNPIVWWLFWTALLLPVSLLLGAGIPWIFYKRKWGIFLFALPLVDVAALAIALAVLQSACNGQFACK